MTNNEPLKNGEALRILWEEYRYRHELCWRVPLQLTAGAVILSTLPYAQCHIVKVLEYRILIVPILGIILTGFGMAIMTSELQLLDVVRARYRDLQSDLKLPERPRSWFVRFIYWLKMSKEFRDRLKPLSNSFTFARRVQGYLLVLLLLQVFNVFLIASTWIPAVCAMKC
jgi:hypothetical protein